MPALLGVGVTGVYNSHLMREECLPDDFDPLAHETLTSAHEEYARLRRECPVAHSSAFNGFWSFFRYQDVVDALRQPDVFITSVQNVVPKVAFTHAAPRCTSIPRITLPTGAH